MSGRSKLKISKPPSVPLMSHRARKSPLLKKLALVSASVTTIYYVLFSTFLHPSFHFHPSHSSSNENLQLDFPGNPSRPKIYMYDLPKKFTYGIVEQHAIGRGNLKEPLDDVTTLKYPAQHHMHEWFLFADLNRPESDRVGSPVIKVTDPTEADLFYVPVFSFLGHSDEEMQESLMEWLEGQEWWRRNGGLDHVIIAGNPNAMYRVKNSVLLVADFRRLRSDRGSLVKDLIIPCSHTISAYTGELGVANRNTLLFFMGNRYRKVGGKVRDLLFQVLENEADVVIKHGTQSRESRHATLRGMHTSKFCLNPTGTLSACNLFDSIVSLCVPVIIGNSIQLPFEDVIDYRKISIFVASKSALKPMFLVKMLRKVESETILQYQKEMKEVRRYFDYSDPDGTVNEIWRQVSQKLPLIKLMINREKRLVKSRKSKPMCACLCSDQTGNITAP